MNHTHLVIVLGLYFPGIDIIKDFKKRGISSIGVDCLDDAPGLLLRKTKTYVCPDPTISEQAWLEFLLQFKVTDGPKPVLMITSDKFILPVLKNDLLLSHHFLYNKSKNSSTERLMNKKSLIEAAKQSDVAVAKTVYYVDDAEFYKLMNSITYPCLIRPSYGKKWGYEPLKSIVGNSKLIKVENEEKLKKWLCLITPYDQDLMVQEMIPGPDHNLYYLVVYIGKEQNCLGYFCGQKLRITPIHFGSASYMKTADPKPILQEALHLLNKNQYWGPAGIEFKLDENTKEFKLVEINTRFGLWDVMGSKLGVNLFYQAYLDLTDQQPIALVPNNKKYKWISITRDFATFLEYRNENLITTWDWMKSFIGKVHYADIYFTEPKLMYELYLKKIIKKVNKKLQGR